MKKRCIMIFPEFRNMDIINSIREKYDPLANFVRPHITLVFPFESALEKEVLENHIRLALRGTECFNLKLEEIIKVDNSLGFYLFLSIKEGEEKIKELSSKLYKGMLSSYKPDWLNNLTFMPHMTIGSFSSKEELNEAYEAVGQVKYNFSTLVEKISVEVIDENEYSIIEMEVPLVK